MNNDTHYQDFEWCPDTVGGKEIRTPWNGQLFAKQVMPFVDMTVKGFLWYQGEHIFASDCHALMRQPNFAVYVAPLASFLFISVLLCFYILARAFNVKRWS